MKIILSVGYYLIHFCGCLFIYNIAPQEHKVILFCLVLFIGNIQNFYLSYKLLKMKGNNKKNDKN